MMMVLNVCNKILKIQPNQYLTCCNHYHTNSSCSNSNIQIQEYNSNHHHDHDHVASKNDSNIETKLLKVAIIGAPNAGKSTLINTLINSQICPTSKKVHTTRKASKAIITEGFTQIIFTDTPGLVSHREFKRYNLEKSFVRDSIACSKSADLIGVIHDVSNVYRRDQLDPKLFKILQNNINVPSFLVFNKIDLLKSKRKLLDLIQMLTDNCLHGKAFTKPKQVISSKGRQNQDQDQDTNEDGKWRNFSEIFMISALNDDGVQDLKDYLLRAAYPAAWMYESGTRSDQQDEEIIVNTVKATLLDFLPQEIPYKLHTQIEYFDIDLEEGGGMHAVVLIKCPSTRIQKLIVGESDGKLKQITAVAQRTLIRAFHSNVNLKIVTYV